jgi:hypothetical protein
MGASQMRPLGEGLVAFNEEEAGQFMAWMTRTLIVAANATD